MSTQYRNNHYVPVWYQERFVPAGQADRELYYLDFQPGQFTDPRGIVHSRRAVRRQGFRRCFSEGDLYRTNLPGVDPTAIEQLFFGHIDSEGRKAVDYFDQFAHPSASGKSLEALLLYMSTQKLRTRKGLGVLGELAGTRDKDEVLKVMLSLRQLYGAVWAESVWLIADASLSETKFVVSDHPITLYNRRCGPRSQWCRGFNDPDIRCNATHTIFPLSLEKVLILTNLSWVRNPYQDEMALRPNPALMRPAIFKFTEIQTLRYLSEQEVREINFIIKSRAFRYIGAAKEEWLYPEKHVSKSDWSRYGNGYLLMPDPRPLALGGTIMWGGGGGPGGAMDAYGRPPWDPEFEKESKSFSEGPSLYRFQGEFARMLGPTRRGRTFGAMRLDPEEDSAEFHNYHLGLVKRTRRG